MKITNIETYPVWGASRNFLFVVIDTDEGLSGVGEAGITERELAVIGAIEHLKPLLIGQNLAWIGHLWQLLFRGGFFPAHPHGGDLGDRDRAVGYQGRGTRGSNQRVAPRARRRAPGPNIPFRWLRPGFMFWLRRKTLAGS